MGKPTPTAELLAETGKLLYPDNPEWLSALAEDLDVKRRTLQAWFSGKMALSPDNTVMQRAEQLLRAEAKLFLDLAARIKRERPSKAKAATISVKGAGTRST
jgi:transcriptional regulator with XRE-family HTH domain